VDSEQTQDDRLPILAASRILGGLAGAPFGPVVALTGVEAGEMAGRMLVKALNRRDKRAASMLSEAVERSGLTSTEFEARLTSSDEHAEVFGRTMEAGARAIATEKLYALADVLASAARTEEPAELDLHLLYADALADIEAPHLEVLRHLYPSRPGIPTSTRPRHLQAGRHTASSISRRHSPPQWQKDGLPHLADGMDALLATLQRHGAAVLHAPDWKGRIEGIENLRPQHVTTTPSAEWSITEFGVNLYELVQQANGFLDAPSQED